MKTFLPLSAMVLLAVGGCTHIATPVDVHTQYVASTLVSPSCLIQCDLNGDGLIQYRLWPETATPSIEEPGAVVYGITESHGPLGDEDVPKDKKLELALAEDDLESDATAEYRCFTQCRGPQPARVMMAQPTMSGADDSAMVPAADSGTAPMAGNHESATSAEPMPY